MATRMKHEPDLIDAIDAAVETVAENAGEAWVQAAYEGLIRYIAHRETPFLAEDVRQALAEEIGEPHDLRAWGQVMRLAAKRGLIEKHGYAPARSSNLSPKVLWAAKRPPSVGAAL